MMRSKLESRLSCEGLTVKYFDSIDSTNLYAERLIRDGVNPEDLIIAGAQTNGQGRVGKSFFSPPGSGLYMTYVYRGDVPDFATARVAIAVLRSIRMTFSLDAQVKWVNDIYFNGKKAGGILCKKVGTCLLIGIGINITKPNDIPADLTSRIGFLTNSISHDKTVDFVLNILSSIRLAFADDIETIRSTFLERCCHLNQKVRIQYDNEWICGLCVGISKDFFLEIEHEGKARAFSSGVLSIDE